MQSVIDQYKSIVVQLATPYSTGTGFLLVDEGIIVTNEHVIRGNQEVVVHGPTIKKQLSRVIYLDTMYDLAFLAAPQAVEAPSISMYLEESPKEGHEVVAFGHPFGLQFVATQGIISGTVHELNEVDYYSIDAALNPGNSGGPLLDTEGQLLGVNTFVIRNGDNIGFTLPVRYLKDSIEAFRAGGSERAIRCAACVTVVFENQTDSTYCPKCGALVAFLRDVEVYEAYGINRTIESILATTGHNIGLARRGPNAWEINQGSAHILVTYHEKSGLITGDAYLCLLPDGNIQALYEYLLRQNHKLEGLNFSIKGQDIILSLLIYDRYLNIDTGLTLFKHLFDRADYYDNVLVDQYGAKWKHDSEE